MSMRIVRSAVCHWHREQSTGVLKSALASSFDVPFRRLNTFSLLSLAGAAQCLPRREAHVCAGVYAGTAQGALADTEKVLRQIYHERQLPMPLDFIYTMSNTATFHIAQAFGFVGPNNLLIQNDCAFERCCQLAGSDLSAGNITHALIGAVDIVPPDLSPEGAGLGRSSWIWCASTGGSETPHLSIRDHRDRDALIGFCESLTQEADGECVASLGIGCPDDLAVDLERRGLILWKDPVAPADRNAASRVARFCSGDASGDMIHITPLPGKGYVTTSVRRQSPGCTASFSNR